MWAPELVGCEWRVLRFSIQFPPFLSYLLCMQTFYFVWVMVFSLVPFIQIVTCFCVRTDVHETATPRMRRYSLSLLLSWWHSVSYKLEASHPDYGKSTKHKPRTDVQINSVCRFLSDFDIQIWNLQLTVQLWFFNSSILHSWNETRPSFSWFNFCCTAAETTIRPLVLVTTWV